MKISKKDALSWFEFFAQLPAGEQLLVKQQEIVYATFAQIEAVVIKRKEELMEQIPGLKTIRLIIMLYIEWTTGHLIVNCQLIYS